MLLAILAVLVVAGATTAIILLTRDSGDDTAGTSSPLATSPATTSAASTAPSPFPSMSSTQLQPTSPDPATTAPSVVTSTPETTGPITSEAVPPTTSAVETTATTGAQDPGDAAAVMAATNTFLEALHAGDLAAAKAASCDEFAKLLTQSVVDGAKDMTATGDPMISGDKAAVPVTYTDDGQKKTDTMPLTRQDDGRWLICIASASSTARPSTG